MATMSAHKGPEGHFVTQCHRVIAREITSEYGAHAALGVESGWVAGNTWQQPAPRRQTMRPTLMQRLRSILITIAGH